MTRSTPMTVSRRDFLQAGAAITLTAASYNRVLGANAAHALGLIGCGHRGKTILGESLKLKQNCLALADVAPFRFTSAGKLVTDAGQEKPETYGDARRLLDRKDIDAVIIAVPDHWHHDTLLAAMQAEKDAYMEKPL